MDKFIEELFDLRFLGSPAPGFSVSVVKDGKPLFDYQSGCADIGETLPITADSVFHVASVTKQFTAYCITLLEKEGKVDVNKSIRSYLPFLPAFADNITLLNLLNHTSGLREQWDLFTLSGHTMEDLATSEHAKRLLTKQKEFSSLPGERYCYCNSGYTLMAMLIKELTGKSIREFADERIFKPLGMDHTFYRDDHGEIVPHRVRSYRPKADGGFREYTHTFDIVGSTSLNTTPADLQKWMANLRQPVVGDEECVRRMTTQGILNSGKVIDYCRGLRRYDFFGLPVREHTGTNSGYKTITLCAGDYDIVILSNYVHSNPTMRCYALLQHLCGTDHVIGEKENYEDTVYPVKCGKYYHNCAIVELKGDSDTLIYNDGDDHVFTHVIGNRYFCRENQCLLYLKKNGFVLYESLTPSAYQPLPQLKLTDYDKKAARCWFSEELGILYEVCVSGDTLVLSSLQNDPHVFTKTGEGVYHASVGDGLMLEFDGKELFLSTARSRRLRLHPLNI